MSYMSKPPHGATQYIPSAKEASAKHYYVKCDLKAPDGATSTLTKLIPSSLGWDLCDIHNIISHYLKEVVDIGNKHHAETVSSDSDTEVEEDEKEACDVPPQLRQFKLENFGKSK